MDEALKIGEKVKKYRTEKNLTVKELAARAQITPSMLSQIEHGQANPSLNTIRLLAKELDTPMFRFFVDEDKLPDDIVRHGSHKHVIGNGVDYAMLTPDTEGNVELCQITLAPGASSHATPISHRGEEVAVVLKGTARLEMEPAVYELNEGDSVRIRSEVRHCWHNESSVNLIVLFAVSPPGF